MTAEQQEAIREAADPAASATVLAAYAASLSKCVLTPKFLDDEPLEFVEIYPWLQHVSPPLI
jgi:hypothetical protein